MFKKIITVLCTAFLLVSFTACSAGEKNSMADYDNVKDSYISEDYSELADGSVTTSTISGEKIIKNADITLKAESYDETIANLNKKIASSDLYIEYSESFQSESDYGGKNGNYTIRVPADKLEDFKTFLKSIGEIEYISENSKNITSEYIDVSARLTALKGQEKRLLEILKEANTVSEIIEIEEKLAEVRMQIEQYTQTIKEYDNKIEYSTVQLYIYEEGVNKTANQSFLEKIGEAFADSFNAFKDILQRAVIVAIWLLPYIICAAVIVFIVIICIKVSRNKRR